MQGSENLDDELRHLRITHSKALFDNIHLCTQLPQLLGKGRMSLVDKVGAHVHSTLLENGGQIAPLQAALESVVAWCSDMGVESGLPQCNVNFVENLLPSFVRPARIHIAQCEDDFVEDGFVPAEQGNRNFLPRALQVPGVCHAIHNMSSNLDSALADFEWFIALVEELDKFIGSRRQRERFVEVVLGETEMYAEGKALFKDFSATLYRQRWGEVATYLCQAWPIFLFLRQFWDPVAYERGGAAEESLDTGKITSLLRDDRFMVYWQVQMKLRQAIQKLLHWAEGCACHASFSGGSQYMREKQLRAEMLSCPPDIPCTCPMMGCRAAEMVAGKLDDFAADVFVYHFNEIVSNSEAVLPVETWAALRQEWFKGGEYVRENLKIRLGFFQCLPWAILGATHPDVDTAKTCLQKALDLWESLPAEAVPFQHKIAVDLFSPGPLRAEAIAFCSPACTRMQDCPLLEEFLAPLTFVQISERIVEGAHKDFGPRPKHGSITSMSIQLRVPELTRRLELEPGCFSDLVDVFARCQKIKNFTKLFPGYGKHPMLRQLESQKRSSVSTSAYISTIRQVLYRDAMSQHADTSEAQVWHESHKRDAFLHDVLICPKQPPKGLIAKGNTFLHPG